MNSRLLLELSTDTGDVTVMLCLADRAMLGLAGGGLLTGWLASFSLGLEGGCTLTIEREQNK